MPKDPNALLTAGSPQENLDNSIWALMNLNRGLDATENQNRDNALNRLLGELGVLSQDFSNQERAVNRSLFSEAGDRSGAASRKGIRNIRSSLGSRGIGSNSAAAASLGAGVEQDRQRALTTSRRDIGRDFTARMTDHRRFRSGFVANSIAPLEAQGNSMILSDTLTDVTNLNNDRLNSANSIKAAKDAGKKKWWENILQVGVSALPIPGA